MSGENKIAWHLPDPRSAMEGKLSWDLHESYVKDVAPEEIEKDWLDIDLILDFYLKEIRPFTEHGVVVWNSGLTKGQVAVLEKVQKVALKIILKTTTYLMTWPVRWWIFYH